MKLGDYVSGVFGSKSREALEWSATSDVEVSQQAIDAMFGSAADAMDQWDEVWEFNEQLYTVLRATTEGIPFDLIENCPAGQGMEAWRALHKKYDPSTGGRKRVMLNALTNPDRVTYEHLGGALERWKSLRSRYDRKKDQLGNREKLPDSIAMNALEKMVPKELETHLLLNYGRFRTFEEMEKEVLMFMEAKTGSRINISSNFAKGSGDAVPMEVDSLIKAVNGTISSLVGNKGLGKGANKITTKFEGTCDLCGKYGHKKKDCWQKGGSPKSGSSKGGSPKGKGAGKARASSAPGKFEGVCNNCGKKGHKKKDCWAPGGGLASSAGKGNSKGKQQANSLMGPEPEPGDGGEAGALELCALGRGRREAAEEVEVEVQSEESSWARELHQPEQHRSRSRQRTTASASRRSTSFASSQARSTARSSTYRSEDGEWLKLNLDTGASVTAIPRKYCAGAVPQDTKGFKTASGEVIANYGKYFIEGVDQCGTLRKVNGQVTDVQKILVSASKLHEKGYYSWLGPGGGYIVPSDGVIGTEMMNYFEQLKEEQGTDGCIPVWEERGVYNFYLKVPTDPTEASEQVASTEEAEEVFEEEAEEEPETAAKPRVLTDSATRLTTSVRRVPKRGEVNAVGEEGDVIPAEPPDKVEAKKANPGWSPKQPTEDERKEHEASGHAVYGSWCQQHRRVDHRGERIPTVVMDYFYLGEEERSKPHFVAKDRWTGMCFATSLDRKGILEGKLLTRFLELLGYKEVVLKSDGERSIVGMKKRAGQNAKGLNKVICEESPAGDSKANGEAEAAVKESKWRTRAIHLMLNEKFEGGVSEKHPIISWIPRHAAEQGNRYKVGEDGRTPEERRTGKKWIKPMPVFGEKIMVKPVGKGRRGDLSRMVEGRYIGTHNRFGSILAMTANGVVVGSGYHTVPEGEKWGKIEEDLKGLPWDVKAYARADEKEADAGPASVEVPPVQPASVVVVTEKADIGGPSGAKTEAPGEKRRRAQPVRRDYLLKYGETPGCDGCLSISRGAGFQQVMHSEECRSRIYGRIDEEKKASEERQKREREELEEIQNKRLTLEEPAGGEGGVRMDAEEPTSPKRKAGEDSVVDVRDLAMEAEREVQESNQASSSSGDRSSVLVDTGLAGEAARVLQAIGAMDVVEVFSPQRVNLEVQRFGMRPGASIDLEEMKPDGSERWDLDKDEDYNLAVHLVAKEQPWLVTSSPPCTTFSPLRRLSNHKRGPKVVAEEERLGEERLVKAIEICKLQMSLGGFFLHEHPKGSTSWEIPVVKELVAQEGVYLVQSPMCKFEMKQVDKDGEGYIRKETLWLTNCKEIAEELEGECKNLKGKELHRHIHLIGGRAKAAQVYPKPLVREILRGLRNALMESKQLSAVEEAVSGPSPDDAVEWDQEVEEFVDDISGASLDPQKVKEARQVELDWLRKEKVYERVPASHAKGALLKLKWVDVNKGDKENVKIRSRIVAKEVKKAKKPHEQMGAAETFSATPPIESVFTLLSIFMNKRKDGKKVKLASWDISRAHFMGTAQREIYVELPPEDQVLPGDTEPMVGRLLRSMYGTQDASKIFQDDYHKFLETKGATFCKLCPAIYKVEDRDVIGLVHGDDFLVVGADEDLKWLDKVFNEKYTARWESLLGQPWRQEGDVLPEQAYPLCARWNGSEGKED